MASEIGKIVHCVICGAPIVAKGNRLFCEECYNQNRRNAAQRSKVETKAETRKEAPNVKVIRVVKGGKAPKPSKAPDSADENGSEVEGDEV